MRGSARTIADSLWASLHKILLSFAEEISAVDPLLVCDLGRSSNQAFALRGFLTFRRSNDGDEIAITVDVQGDEEQAVVKSDICTDDGTMLADGPSVTIEFTQSERAIELATDYWAHKFEQFLLRKKSVILDAASQLT